MTMSNANFTLSTIRLDRSHCDFYNSNWTSGGNHSDRGRITGRHNVHTTRGRVKNCKLERLFLLRDVYKTPWKNLRLIQCFGSCRLLHDDETSLLLPPESHLYLGISMQGT